MEEDLIKFLQKFPEDERENIQKNAVAAYRAMSIDEKIDYLLPIYVHGNNYLEALHPERALIYVYLQSDYSDNEDLLTFLGALSFMEAEGLLIPGKDGPIDVYHPSLIAIRIDGNGGWLKHHRELETQRQKELEQMQANIDTAQSVRKNQKVQNSNALVVSIATVVIMIATIRQCSIAENTLDKKDRATGSQCSKSEQEHHCNNHKTHSDQGRTACTSASTTHTDSVSKTRKDSSEATKAGSE